MTDHPLIRASLECPLCGGWKNRGLVACWTCYRKTDLRSGNRKAEQALDWIEAALTDIERLKRVVPYRPSTEGGKD